VLDNIKFKTSSDAKVQIFKPDELYGYQSGEDFFLSKKEMNGGKFFVKRLVDGRLCLYSEYSAAMTTSPTGGSSMSSSTQFYLQRESEAFLTPVTGNFKNQMLGYLKDAPEICKAIEDKTLKRKDLEVVVRMYNEEVGQ
jgi:hypothetical protein